MASALPTLYVSTTGLAGSYTAVASSATGNVTYNGSAGVWNLVVTTGLTAPALGTHANPSMDLSIQASSTAGGSLYIGLVDTGFTGVGSLAATISGHVVSGAPESYLFNMFADTSNTQPTTTLPTGSIITTLSGVLPVLATTTGTLPGTSPYALGEVVEITSTGATTTSIDAGSSTVPDGGTTAMMLGLALSGLALLKRKIMA